MNIIRLSKVIGVVEVVITLKELQEEEVVFVLNEKVSIFKFIEKLSLNGVNISTLKIVNEINFNFGVLLKDKFTGEIISEVKCLSEALQYITPREIDRYMLVLLTDENHRTYISEIMQQFIYLDLHIDVMLEKEEHERKAVNSFKDYFNSVKSSLKAARNGIIDSYVSPELEIAKSKFVNIIDDIERTLLEAEERELTVAVMATKKSGKSVIVNSFLGNDYSPSGFELPTQNSIIYKSNSEGTIKLNYNNESKEFDDVDLLRNYVEGIYKYADSNFNNTEFVEDMYIFYKNEKQTLNNFTIIDTPGPNLAGSNHREIAYKWIEAADVVIFVIDYSKYLTTDEENYLRDIKTFFDKYDKSHSLIVIVNKIDLMYASGEKNSVVRFLDFLQFKLKELGYKGFVIFAASSLQYFSAIKVPKLKHCEALYEVELHGLTQTLKKCKANYIGKKELSIIRTLEDYIRDLEDYQGIEDVTLMKIIEKSGMPRIMNYTNYITTHRANVELYKAAMRKIDDKYVNIKNNFFTFQLTNLSERKKLKERKKEELLNAIRKLYEMVEIADSKIKEVLDLSKMINEIELICKVPKEELLWKIDGPIKEELASIKEAFMYNKNNELKDLVESSSNSANLRLQTNFHRILSDMFNEKTGICIRKINGELDKKQELLSLIDKNIQEDIGVFNDHLNNNLGSITISITLPKLELAFSRKNFDFSKADTKAVTEIYEILKKSHYQKYGFKGRLMKLATLNYVDKRYGKYELDYESLDEMMSSLLPDIKNEIVCTIEDNNEKILQYIITYLLEELEPKIKNETEAIISNYKELIMEINEAIQASESNLENDISFIQEKIDFLEVAKNSLQMFFNVWETIRQQAASVKNYEDTKIVV